MSGVAGIITFNKQPVDLHILEKMSRPMAHRGSDGIYYSIVEHAGFCNLITFDTPESRFESLPYTTSDKHLTIVFHGRIDNREELFIQTGRQGTLSQIPDSQLVVAAFKRWGNDCIGKLLGDFAFAIWIHKDRTLFCGRDHMGVKPFFYRCSQSFFAFASEIKSLLQVTDCRRRIDLERVADFPVYLTTENKTTFFRDVFRLQPAHFLIVRDAKVEEKRYWSLQPAHLTLNNTQEYQEAFYHIFQDAVRVRLRSDSRVGAYLSGGLDSSSIVCMAAGPLNTFYPGKLHTYSGIFDRITECDERAYFQPVVDKFDIIPHYVQADELLPGEMFDAMVESEDEPIFSPHFFMNWSLLHMAQQGGIRVLLDGHDGDATISHGYGLLPQLALQGRILRLYRELRGFPNATRKNVVRNILYMYRGLLLSKLPFYTYTPANKSEWRRKLSFLTPECLSKTNVGNKMEKVLAELPDSYQTEEKRHRLGVTQPFHPFALEFLERAAGRFGINQYFPFFDIRLISFCLALPAEEKLHNGYNRNIVRNSLGSLLPEAIRKRKTKSIFNKNLTDAYTIRDREWLSASVENATGKVYDIINKHSVTDAYNECLGGGKTSPVMALNSILLFLALAKWLGKPENRELEVSFPGEGE